MLRGVDVGKVDIATLAQIALEGRAAALQKSQPHLTREAAFSMAVEQHADIFNIQREANRARLAGGELEKREAATIARRFYATALLTKHADEIRKVADAVDPSRADRGSQALARHRGARAGLTEFREHVPGYA